MSMATRKSATASRGAEATSGPVLAHRKSDDTRSRPGVVNVRGRLGTQTNAVVRRTGASGSLCLGVGALAMIAPRAAAQPVFAPLAPPPLSAERAASFFSTNGVAAESILTAAAPDPESRHPLRWGPFAAHPRIDYRYNNANGIPQGLNRYSTIQHTIGPGLALQMGPQWNLNAGLSLGYYTEKALNDTFGYNVGINGGIPREDWTFGVTAGFGASEETQTETAQQTSTQSYGLGLTAVYGARHRVSYEFGVNQNFSLSSSYNDAYTWSTLNWVNYVATPKTTLGLGLGGGYTVLQAGELSSSSTGTDSAYEQIQGRFVWRPADKLSFNISGGAQIQQFFADAGTLGEVNPISSLSAGYNPVDGTSFTLSGSRTVGTAITTDEYTQAYSFSLGFSQRFLKHFTFGLTPAYSVTEYRSNTDPSAKASRTDDVLSISVSLSTVLLKKLAVSTFFTYSDNQSDDDYYAYESRQFGFQVGYRF